MIHEYEKTQNYNVITKILHSTRYRNLERLVKQYSQSNKRLSIVDIGCGPAKTYDMLKRLSVNFQYTGIEIRQDFSELARTRYDQFDNFEIICDSIENAFHVFDNADIIIGLESFEHIPEPIVVRTVEAIGKSDFKLLYITVPNEVGPAIFIKNVGSFLMGYRRFKEYRWAETFAASVYDLDKVDRHETGQKGFDWRWLAHTIRQNCKISKITTSPLQIIPCCISPSIGFICKNDKD